MTINRLRALRVDSSVYGAPRPSGRPRASVVLRPYHSLMELRQALDLAAGARLHAILALPADFNGHLPSLIELSGPAASLVLTAAGRDFPALPNWSFATEDGELGWRKITFDPDWVAAIRHAATTAPADARVEIFWPAWLSLDETAFDQASAATVQQGCNIIGTLSSYHHSA